MFFILELIIGALAAYLFIVREKPKVKFLWYGYLLFLVAAVLQIPFRYLQAYFAEWVNLYILPSILLTLGPIIISELTKYFALKRFLKTKSYKDSILFGIGWSTLESINYFTIVFFTFVMSLLSLNFTYALSLSSSVPLVDFVFFFITNVAITVFVIFSIIKKKMYYLFYAIFYSLLVHVSLVYLVDMFKFAFAAISFLYSLFVIYRYKYIK